MPARNATKASAKPTSRITNALKSYLFDGILLVALGLVLLLLPKVSLTILCVIIGVALIIMGLIKLIFFAANVNGVRRIADIPVGIIQLVLGFWLIIDSSLFINLFQIVTGVILIYGSLLMFVHAFALREIRGAFYWLSLVFGILCAVLGIVIVVNPAGFAAFMMQLQGVALIIEGLALIVVMHTVKREMKNATSASLVYRQIPDAQSWEDDEPIPAEVVDESDEYLGAEELAAQERAARDRGRTAYYGYGRTQQGPSQPYPDFGEDRDF